MDDEGFLALSGIQHFAFCRRQWALIHIEQAWSDNVLTVEGDLLHRRAHDPEIRERRGDLLTVRSLAVHSERLGFRGLCDVVEFRRGPTGFPVFGEEGLWSAAPVEYKRGSRKAMDADRMQLCAQAMCLEEMLGCDVSEGFIFYGVTKSRERVSFDLELRESVMAAAEEMRRLYSKGYTPKVKPFAGCKSCSLRELCFPRETWRPSVSEYLDERLPEDML